jgi:hypothetical protein
MRPVRRRPRTALLVVLAWLASLAAMATARASEERIVVVAEEPASALVRKLQSELANGAYAVEVLHATESADLGAQAAAHHARVVLRVSPDGDSVDLWIADHLGDAIRFRERITAPEGDGRPSVIAIRAHEAVHAKLLRIAPNKPPLSAAAEGPPARPAAPPPPRFSASVGASALASPGGVGVAVGAALGFSFFVTDRASLDAIARIPVVAGHLEGPEGTARVNITAIGGGLSLALTPRDAWLRPGLGVGVAFEWLHVDGVANPPFVSSSDDLFAALPYARFSVSVALTGALRLRADLLGALSVPGQAITFAGRRAATFGRPLADGSLALEFVW